MTAEEIVCGFIHSYRAKPTAESDSAWLARELKTASPEGGDWDAVAGEIATSVERYRKAFKDLNERLGNGESQTRYVYDAVTNAARTSGVSDVAAYAARIDGAISHANQMMWDTVHRKDGGIKQAFTLHGNIAEASLAGESSLRQAVAECNLKTEQPRVNEAGSADTQIVDQITGRIVSQQQMKFYPTAEATLAAYLKGDYVARGQSLVAPADQVARIRQLRPDIDVRATVDGVHGGVTYDEVVEIQRRVQQKGIVPEKNWRNADAGVICKHIGIKAVQSGILAMGFQAVRIAGKRMWNGLTGQKNPTIEADLNEFGECAIKSGANAGMTTAVAGGLTLAVRRGVFGSAFVKVSPCVIGNLACLAVENIKIFSELGSGKISSKEALDRSCNNTCALLGSLAVGTEFAAAVGTALAPGIGTVVGGVVGSLVGSVGGHAIYQGAKAAVRAVGNFVSRVASSVGSAVSCTWSAVKNLFA